jgi:hypothetical protein
MKTQIPRIGDAVNSTLTKVIGMNDVADFVVIWRGRPGEAPRTIMAMGMRVRMVRLRRRRCLFMVVCLFESMR